MSKSTINNEERPANSEVKLERRQELDYKAEYYALLDYLNELGFSLQLNYRNIKNVGFRHWLSTVKGGQQ